MDEPAFHQRAKGRFGAGNLTKDHVARSPMCQDIEEIEHERYQLKPKEVRYPPSQIFPFGVLEHFVKFDPLIQPETMTSKIVNKKPVFKSIE